MSLLVNTVQPSPGQYYFAASGTDVSGGGGGGDTVVSTLTVEPVNAPAMGVAPAITIASGGGSSITLWEEGLVNQATGTPVNSGNDLTFLPYSDANTALPNPIIFKRSNGSVRAANLQISNYVYLPTPLPLSLTGAFAGGVQTFTGAGGGPDFPTFTPADTGLYVMELEATVNVTGSDQFIIPASAFLRATLTGGGSGGSVPLKPWAQPLDGSGTSGTDYTLMSSNTFSLTAGTTYTLTMATINPTNAIFGLYQIDGTTPGTTGTVQLFVNVYSLCRVDTPFSS